MTNLNEKINKKSKTLIDDLLLSIVGQIKIFNFNKNDSIRPGAIYGVSRCLRMLHEHFKTGYTDEAIKYLNSLKISTDVNRSIREVYKLNSTIEKSNRKLYVEHTDGGVKKLASDLLKLSYFLKNENEHDKNLVLNHIKKNSFFIIKHKDFDANINHNTNYNS
jgi:hypothetical protein